MAFQQFRLGELSLHPSITPHIPDTGPSHTTFATNPHKSVASSSKQPYGSGDSDDGYTLSFPDLDAFQQWRQDEEERNMVEFVKGDTHGSKAVPPRFKDHTKLVCARHSRSGRKKYVKKHPERVRKVPSRKLEGQGCPASISYKTYYDTEEVRACYISQHSHEIGIANLPYTRRGRKAAVQTEKEKRSSKTSTSLVAPTTAATSSSSIANAVPPISSVPTPASVPPPPADTPNQTMNSPQTMPAVIQQQQQQPQHQPQQQQQQQQPQQQQQQQQVQQVMGTANAQMQPTFTSAVSMLAPLPNQQQYQAPQQAYGYAPVQQYPLAQAQDRWDNMSTLFHTVREHARSFEYPQVSVAALETVLIRLYLESPMGVGTPTHNLGAMAQMAMARQTGQGQPGQMGPGHPNGGGHDGTS
ncbi:hypothetical protein EST38_g3296 [Candolleomyces aberdarensis]|uniref:Uncharacterized protein n=1 Tax=Candolleomyces aberdarensis TaxID=2316362 RepID=A0A4Q2DQB4_9AGAR|nr:hypothetical protein EST38_g3296 [Candolleomyces aberdarensis]